MSTAALDEPRALRDEDAFDAAALHAWLGERVAGLGPAAPAVEQFTGGASNRTYLLRYPERELILRRPPAGEKAASAHDMRREATLQQRLRPVYPYVPDVLAIGANGDAGLGDGDFYVMERLRGVILRGALPRGVTLEASQARALCETVVERLVELHRVDVDAAGLADLGRGAGYVERQVAGWSERYRRARTRGAPRGEHVMRWLERHRPPDGDVRVIHNDFRFDNVVLDAADLQRVVGVLDWEMATLGDPLMDLGGALAYWVEADDDRLMQALRRQPTHLPGMLTRREVVARYCERQGVAVPDAWPFYEVFGLFRLSVIAQQIYRRYARRETRNPAFRHYWAAVRYLDWRCRRTIRAAG